MFAPDGDGGFKLTIPKFKLTEEEDFPDLGEAEELTLRKKKQ